MARSRTSVLARQPMATKAAPSMMDVSTMAAKPLQASSVASEVSQSAAAATP